MTFTPKTWLNAPNVSTPLSAAALIDLETRVTDYAAAKADMPINVKDAPYNAVGDGVTDDTAALQAAFAAALTEGRPAYMPPGDYLATGQLVPTSTTVGGTHVIGAGPDLTKIIHGRVGGVLFGGIGAQGGNVAVGADIAVGARVITLATTTGLIAGDFLKLKDSAVPIRDHQDESTVALQGEYVRVRSVDSGTQVTLWGQTEFAYTAATSTVNRMRPVTGYTIENLTIENPTSGALGSASFAIQIDYAQSLRFRKLVFRGLDDDAIRLSHALDVQIEGCEGYDLRSEQPHTPYLVNLAAGCTNVLVDGCILHRGRHLITSGAGATEPESSFVQVSNCVGQECYGAVFDQHPGGGRYWTFTNCQAHAGDRQAALGAFGFQLRGRFTTVIAPVVSGCEYGIHMVYGEGGRVIGGQINNCDVGVVINSNPGAEVHNTRITGSLTNAIWVKKTGTVASMPDIVLDDIDIVGNPSGAAVDFDYWHDSFRVEDIRALDATTKFEGKTARNHHNGYAGILAPSNNAWVVGALGLTANRAYISRFVPTRPMIASKIVFLVSTAASTDDACDVGIYDDTGARMVSKGSTLGLLNSVGRKEVTLPSTVRLSPGVVYYAAFSSGAQGGTAAQLYGAPPGISLGVAAQIFGTAIPDADGLHASTAHPLAASPAWVVGGTNFPVLGVLE